MTNICSRSVQTGLSECAEIVLSGGVVAFPTDTVYGLGALYDCPGAIERIYSIKERVPGHALPVLVYSLEQLEELTSSVPPLAKSLIKRFWPGALTIVMERSARVPNLITGGRNSIALRMPAHTVTLALLEKIKRPVCATSANISGKPPALTAKDVRRRIGERLDYILGGATIRKIESTVVDVTGKDARVLRSGAIESALITKIISGGEM